MTEMETEMETQTARLSPQPGSRLADLLAVYDEARQTAEAAAERLKVIVDAIKAESAAAAPGATSIALDGPTPLQLQARTRWQLDTKALKAAEPET
jgi:hypothetical protein